ncbi:MAG: hypothetical protein ACU843_19450 [Gammaproteobacteria bacterium]
MNKTQFDYVGMILKSTLLGAIVYSSTAIAENYECMLVNGSPLNSSITAGDAKRGAFPDGKLVLEGVNFGTNPKVYFGSGREVVEVVDQSRNNNFDSITLQLPVGTGTGTYKLIIQNRSGPFLDNNGERNPIFCFGSVTIGMVSGYSAQ